MGESRIGLYLHVKAAYRPCTGAGVNFADPRMLSLELTILGGKEKPEPGPDGNHATAHLSFVKKESEMLHGERAEGMTQQTSNQGSRTIL